MLSLLILPIITMILILTKDSDNSMIVGVYFQNEDNITSNIVTQLHEYEDIKFEQVFSYDDLYDKVISKDFVLGYNFDESFSDKVKTQTISNIVDVVKLEDDMYSNFIAPIVISSVYEQMAIYISSNRLESEGIQVDINQIIDDIKMHNNSSNTFAIDMFNVDTINTTQSEENHMLFRGIICVFLCVLSLISMIFCMDNSKSQLLYIYINKNLFKLYSILPIYFLTTISAIVSMIIYSFVYVDINIFLEIGIILIYQFSLILTTVILSNIINKQVIILLIPFIIMGLILTHPILFDLTLFLPQIKYILNFLPTYQYTNFTFMTLILGLFVDFIFIFILFYPKKLRNN